MASDHCTSSQLFEVVVKERSMLLCAAAVRAHRHAMRAVESRGARMFPSRMCELDARTLADAGARVLVPRRRRGYKMLRTSHSPAVPTADITSAPPSAHPKLSILR